MWTESEFCNSIKIFQKMLEQSKPAKPLSQGKQSISVEAYLQWGNVNYNLGDYKVAIADYTAAIRLKPDLVDAYYNRGMAKAKLGQYFAAILDFDIAIRLEPN